MNVEWQGTPGHFICADRCMFRMHCHVNGYCISTIGEFRPTRGAPIEAIGGGSEASPGRLYETMVFRLLADGDVDPTELECTAYMEREEARLGHLRVTAEWGAK